MDSFWTDLQDGYDGDVWNDCFAPASLACMFKQINGESNVNGLQKL